MRTENDNMIVDIEREGDCGGEKSWELCAM